MSSDPDAVLAPEIDGFELRRTLGAGGFSTVYLYEQMRPRREVAIKVLTTRAFSEEGQRRFEIEANLMAELSAHPYIVTIHDADITDDGRPYLVMEYYSGANLGLRARSEQLGLAEVLQVGIHIAGAVESAHRLGILHRDIKPANVLTSRYNRPGLTDFGIAVSASSGEHGELALSVPWSPPEAFESSPHLEPSADIYSLGAFIYSLLKGRSPFEEPGGDNTPDAIAQRIMQQSPAPIHRQDVPAEFERLLLQSMSRNPALRQASALALAQGMQAVELDLGLPPTPIDLMEADASAEMALKSDTRPGVEATRLRLTTLEPVATRIETEAAKTAAFAAPTALLDEPAADATVRMASPSRRRGILVLAALGTVLLILLLGVALTRSFGSDTDVTPQSTPSPSPSVQSVKATPAPSQPAIAQPTVQGNGNGKGKGNGKGNGKPAKKPKGH